MPANASDMRNPTLAPRCRSTKDGRLAPSLNDPQKDRSFKGSFPVTVGHSYPSVEALIAAFEVEGGTLRVGEPGRTGPSERSSTGLSGQSGTIRPLRPVSQSLGRSRSPKSGAGVEDRGNDLQLTGKLPAATDGRWPTAEGQISCGG